MHAAKGVAVEAYRCPRVLPCPEGEVSSAELARASDEYCASLDKGAGADGFTKVPVKYSGADAEMPTCV